MFGLGRTHYFWLKIVDPWRVSIFCFNSFVPKNRVHSCTYSPATCGPHTYFNEPHLMTAVEPIATGRGPQISSTLSNKTHIFSTTISIFLANVHYFFSNTYILYALNVVLVLVYFPLNVFLSVLRFCNWQLNYTQIWYIDLCHN